ncbi:MAG: two-component system response regulator [Magnetococcales bacterium]|nr:two-component system response regulator [Magnetococcales bacterium]
MERADMDSDNGTVLIVDDERLNINLLVDLLGESTTTLVAKSGAQALKRAMGEPIPDLILLDIMMPEMDGYEVLRRLKAEPRTREIPVIFVTAMGEVDDETKGFELGVVDYITKPFSPPVVQARVRTHLALAQAHRELADQNHRLESTVRERTRELVLTQDVTMHSLASLAETRDNETGNHIRRTQHYVRLLAERLKDHPRFLDDLDDATIELLFKSAPLHDMGKVGVPDQILLKPGRLTDEEFAIMKTHTTLGRDAISMAESTLGAGETFLHHIREIAYSHHEKWDGSGYPEGLAGEAIPLAGRLMAVADVYDALISKRVYKPAFPHEKAVAIITEGRGSHFDPEMVDAFIDISEEFHNVAGRFADSD